MADQTAEDRIRDLKLKASAANEAASRHAAARQVAEVQRETLIGRLVSEYGVETLEAGKALLAHMRAELEETVASAEAALEGVQYS